MPHSKLLPGPTSGASSRHGLNAHLVRALGFVLALAAATSLGAEPAPGSKLRRETLPGSEPADILTVPADLTNLIPEEGPPQPGKQRLQTLPRYQGTGARHTVYLPADWKPGRPYPVLVEYRGNTSRVADPGGLGLGISGGRDFIWLVLPFVSGDGKSDEAWWWGDIDATVAYAKEVVPAVCREWGGDPSRVILTGHSRGAIACNFIGLRDAEIARLWRAIIPVSHYDDDFPYWSMSAEDRARAPERLKRLGRTPQYVCGEYGTRPQAPNDREVRAQIQQRGLTTFAAAQAEQALALTPLQELEGTERFLATHYPEGDITLVDMPFVNHTADIFLRDSHARRHLRNWLHRITLIDPPTGPIPDR
jgi:hypothetical protein